MVTLKNVVWSNKRERETEFSDCCYCFAFCQEELSSFKWHKLTAYSVKLILEMLFKFQYPYLMHTKWVIICCHYFHFGRFYSYWLITKILINHDQEWTVFTEQQCSFKFFLSAYIYLTRAWWLRAIADYAKSLQFILLTHDSFYTNTICKLSYHFLPWLFKNSISGTGFIINSLTVVDNFDIIITEGPRTVIPSDNKENAWKFEVINLKKCKYKQSSCLTL